MKWISKYKDYDMYQVSRDEFAAMNRRERNKVYLVNNYMILNDVIVGIFDNYVAKAAPAGLTIYEALGMERPVVAPKPKKAPRKVEAPAEPQVDTLIE